MDNPETMSMLDTQDTGRTQKNTWCTVSPG